MTRVTGSCARVLSVLALAVCWLGGCAADPKQETFASPDAAYQALVSALRAEDHDRLHAILGPDSDDLVSSGDDVMDRQNRTIFLAAYDAKHKLETEEDGSVTVSVGENEWPMPIPVVKAGDVWRFDTAAGKDELLSRRIGRNELTTIEVCKAVVDAQQDYVAMDVDGSGPGQYAQRFISQEGKRDGLYWESPEGLGSPLAQLVALASLEGYTAKPQAPDAQPRPFHGYRFRMLTSQGPDAPGGAMNFLNGKRMTGGFAAVAYPADYGASGLKTFMVGSNGVVFQKDLGDATEKDAAAIATFNPDSSWEVVED